MSMNNYDEYSSQLRERYSLLESVKEVDARRRRFCYICTRDFLRGENHFQVLIELMNCKELFPSVEDKTYFLKNALNKRSLEIIKLLEAGSLKIHEVTFEDGMSALHYLVEVMYEKNDSIFPYIVEPKAETLKLIEYFLDNPRKNFCDKSGYTYLHGACMSGNVTAVNLLLNQGVNVNLDTYTCSPLHIAAQYRHADVVEILLTHGANPKQRDSEQFTPLHALARLCLCQCTDGNRFCDKRKPVDKLVRMLVDHGADIEARNCHGYTPLELSVSRLDLQLTRALLKYGAKIENLNEDNMFKMTFTPLELKNYPLTLNIIEMAHLLKSAGYNLSLQARLRMMKYWMQIRGNDTDHLISEYNGPLQIMTTIRHIVLMISIHRKFGLYIKQEADDFLNQQIEKLITDNIETCHDLYQSRDSRIDILTAEIERTKEIMLTKDVSLYEMWRMSYSKGYSLIKGIKNWRLPAMDDISCTYVNMIAKRHLANILIRPHLEWLVADFFMTDHCQLNLPYLACQKIAEHMSDEDLFRLCQKTNENQLRPNTKLRRKRCDESGSSASSETPMRRSRRLQGLSASDSHS